MRNFKNISLKERQNILVEKINNPFIKTSILAKKYDLRESSLNTFFQKNHATTRELTGIRYRKYNVDDNFFNKIDSHEKAYLLGVWYSDGYLVTEGNNTKRIGLDVKDEDWLISIKQTLKSEAPLYKTTKENLKRLKITSSSLYNNLIKLGCIEHKTFLLKFPTEDQVPSQYIFSFILGILDGDGSIIIATPRKENHAPEYSIKFTGTKELLQGIQQKLELTHLLLSQRFPERQNNNYSLQISGTQQVAKILMQLYKNAPSCVLQRKKEKYLQIINDSRVLLKNKMLIPANANDNAV